MAKTNTISGMAAALRNAKSADTPATQTADNTPQSNTQTATPQPAVASPAAPAPAETPKQTQVTDNAQQTMAAAPASASTAPSEEQVQQWRNARGAQSETTQPQTQEPTKAEVEADGIKPVDEDNDAEYKGFNDQIKYLKQMAEARKPESDADKAKREKKERRQKTMAKIFDGINALSNLYFTTQGAPSAYKYESESHMTPLQKRIEEAKKEREKNDDDRNNFLLKIGDLYNQRAELAAKIGNGRAARYYADKKDKREDEAHDWERVLQPYKQEEQGYKRDKAKADSETARSAANYADRLNSAKVATEGSRKAAYDASANNSNASANKTRSETKQRPWAWVKNANGDFIKKYFNTDEEADNAAKENGSWVSEQIEEVTETQNGSGRTKSTTKKTRQGGHRSIKRPRG